MGFAVFCLHNHRDSSMLYEVPRCGSLQEAGAEAHMKLYVGKTHTQPIVEDPMRGGKDELLDDVLSLVSVVHHDILFFIDLVPASCPIHVSCSLPGPNCLECVAAYTKLDQLTVP